MFSLEFLRVLRQAEIGRVVRHFPAGARVLEIGAGTGDQARELARHGFEIEAVEIPSSVYADDRVFPVVDYDGVHLPLADGRFDVVFSSSVLEHVVDFDAMQSEVKRVLRPSGICLHVLPTHVWRMGTTLAAGAQAFQELARTAPGLVARATRDRGARSRLPRDLARALSQLARESLQGRHGEHGNELTELLRFHPSWWRRSFRRNGFRIVREEEMGLFYTGHLVLAARLSLTARARLASVIGSSCRLFELALA